MMTACDLSAIAKPWEIQSKVAAPPTCVKVLQGLLVGVAFAPRLRGRLSEKAGLLFSPVLACQAQPSTANRQQLTKVGGALRTPVRPSLPVDHRGRLHPDPLGPVCVVSFACR